MEDILKMEDLFKRWTEYLDSTRSRVSHPPPVNCDFCGGEHCNDDCHLYSMKNSWWRHELHPYNQYEEEGTPNLEGWHGKSYSMENYRWEQELQPYNQYEEERSSDLDNLLMQFKKTIESTQRAFKSLEIQVGKLVKEVAKFVATREENFVEVEAHEESLVEEHDSREKGEEKSEEKAQQWKKCSQVEIQQESILQVNTPPHQLIVKEERHGEHEKSISVILSLITSTSLAMTWKVFPKYMSFMESLAKR
ncbi:hypothetical protein JHK85_000491 [Glycine max]|nr:hypothetical protein JHK85_000491 [Glycine max]KHN01243.1 hypothetical protein glysoja_008145 [Glycine soja]